MRLLVGCPVRDRAWILRAWFDHVETACDRADIEPSYVFAVPTGDPSLAVIDVFHEAVCDEVTIVATDEDLGADERRWNEARFHHMVAIRNQLLGAVRVIAPDLFLSLDSDILIHPDAVVDLVESARDFGAVAGATYMTESGTTHPNFGWNNGMSGFIRRPETVFAGVMPVGVIMAAKMMTPPAYWVDYAFNPQGEDIGWSVAAEGAKVTLAHDSRHVSKHVMRPELLGVADLRCGY